MFWERYEKRLAIEAGLDSGSAIGSAAKEYSNLQLQKEATVTQTETFLTDYARIRLAMLEQELLSESDEKLILREIEDFKTKIKGSDLLKYLLLLPEIPTIMDSPDPDESHNTLLGRCRQWLRGSKEGPKEKPGPKDAEGGLVLRMAGPKEQDLSKKQQKEVSKDAKKIDEALLKLGAPKAPGGATGGGLKEAAKKAAALLALDDGNRFRAARPPQADPAQDSSEDLPAGQGWGTRWPAAREKNTHALQYVPPDLSPWHNSL